jgi:hypothetical protein
MGDTRDGFSRRDFLRAMAGAGAVIVGGSVFWPEGYSFGASTTSGGTSTLGSGTVPEQIHLVWGADASSEMTVSWATPQVGTAPQVTVQEVTPTPGPPSTVVATPMQYTDGLSGETVFCYHAPLTGLTPGAMYNYTISDPTAPTPPATFSSSFTMADTGRFGYTFTSYGDLATPGLGATYTWAGETAYSNGYSESEFNSYYAVSQVEAIAPLFHLLNGDLAYADKETISSTGATHPSSGTVQPAPEVWRDFGLNAQRSAANRPWMACIGNHEAELDNGPQGYAAWNTRFMFPNNNAVPSWAGNYYYFQVGSVLFISLDANDVCYQGGGAYNVGLNGAITDAEGTSIAADAHSYNRQYTGAFGSAVTGSTLNPPTNYAVGTLPPGSNQQTLWLQNVLASARPGLVPPNPSSAITTITSIVPTSIDWIVVQMHQSALSSSNDNGCDAGIREVWVPLFDTYEVDLVLNGHDHDYERSWPCRGVNSLGGGYSIFGAGTSTSAWNKSWPSTSYYGYSPYNFQSGSPPAPGVNTYAGPTAGAAVNTLTPNPVATSGTSFDSTQGTVYMVLGGGGTNKPDNDYGGYNSTGALVTGRANVTTFTQIRVGEAVGGAKAGTKPLPDASELCNWSAIQGTGDISSPTNTTSDGNNSYGIAAFAVDPGTTAGGSTTITVTYYETSQVTSTSPAPTYLALDTFKLTRTRSDGSGPPALPEFSTPALAAGSALALAGGALYVAQRRRTPDETPTAG